MRIGIQVVCAFYRYEATKECRQMDSRFRGIEKVNGTEWRRLRGFSFLTLKILKLCVYY